MEIAFESRDLRDVCQSQAVATERLGEETASQLRHRLADLRAAATLGDLPPGAPSPNLGTRDAEMIVQIGDQHLLVLVPNHSRPRLTASGDADWSRIHRIRVTRIEERT